MSQRIKIAQITEATTAGVRRHLFDLVAGLDKSRFDVTVIASTLRDPGFAGDIPALRKAGAQVHVVQMQRQIHPLPDVRALVHLTQILKQLKPDIVHTHSSKGGFLGRLAAHIAGINIVVHTPHVFPFEMMVPRLSRGLYLKLERMAARWTDRYVCVSEAELKSAKASSLADTRKFVLIPNGIDSAVVTQDETARSTMRIELGCAKDDAVVGFVGRLTRQKGLEHLLDAAKLVCASCPSAKFVIVGTGELHSALEAKVDLLGLASRFTFAGHREDARKLYGIFDIFVLPSLWESLPYSLLESMSANCAIVATSAGGMKEVLRHGENGLLVPPADAAALSEALIRLLKDPLERARLGSAARGVVCSRYQLKDMLKSTSELYDSLVKGYAEGSAFR